jgi:23S rRNA pseudouridine2605 synthase
VFRKLPELATGRWIAVGRLDINTSGLLLLTNHGELARRLTHPSFEIRREYAVRVLGEVDADTLKRLRKGVELEDGLARFEDIVVADGLPLGAGDDDEAADGGERVSANRWLHVALREGRNREVRRLFDSQGLQVSRLIRVAYGPIRLGGGVRSGSYRELDRDELKSLLAAVKLDPKTTLNA